MQIFRISGSSCSLVAAIRFPIPAVHAGASMYLLKTMSVERIKDEIVTAYSAEPASKINLDDRLAYMKKALTSKTTVEIGVQEGKALTAREVEVMQLVVEGLMSKEIADAMSLSVRTVENH